MVKTLVAKIVAILKTGISKSASLNSKAKKEEEGAVPWLREAASCRQEATSLFKGTGWGTEGAE